MNRKDFDERIKLFKQGDWIKLHCRGNYGEYSIEGKFKKVDARGFVHLDQGFAHSYRRITAIHTE